MAGKYWLCKICGYIHQGEEPPDACPVCGAGADAFVLQVEEPREGGSAKATGGEGTGDAEYLAEWARPEDDFDRKYARVVHLAKTGRSEVSAMRTRRTFIDWDEVLFRGAQLHPMPLNEDVPVNTGTVIGRSADKPLEISMPVYVSHMSFGALSREAKIALATGATRVGTAMCSGEGGMLPEEREAADRYVYELGTAMFSHVDDVIRQADAVELKIGQAAKPGLGGHLPAEKVTEEIAGIRGIPLGESSTSPGRYTGLETPDDLRREVERVRALMDGRPVGVKITAGHLGRDLQAVITSGADFVTIDCRGGATGAAPNFIKDHFCLPPIFAISRARHQLDGAESDLTLCVTGGFRDSTDVAKALAMGADAVAMATASLISIGCQQYRICDTGRCPVGITTQDSELRARLQVEKSADRFVRFYEATKRELEILARVHGKNDVHDLDVDDLFTLSSEISDHTDIEHA